MCEKSKALARCKPTTYGFKDEHFTPTPLRPVVSCLFSAIYDLYASPMSMCEKDKLAVVGEKHQGKALEFKSRNQRFDSRFVFFTRRRRRCFSNFCINHMSRRGKKQQVEVASGSEKDSGGARTHDLWF